MKAQEATQLGVRLAKLVQDRQMAAAEALLAPVLAERTPFALLDRIGVALGAAPAEAVNPFLENLAVQRNEGGWPVIGSALRCQLDGDWSGAFSRCRRFIVDADIWYATDILGERVCGPALLSAFQPALDQLAPWRGDANRWVRRTTGVAVHFWAKRRRGQPGSDGEAQALMAFLQPQFTEREQEAVKGVGWGLKTLGRYYPDRMADWLREQVAQRRPYRALMLRKALTYLPAAQRARVIESAPS